MPGFLSVRAAAQWASVSQKTMQRWIGHGLPVYQEGQRTKVLIKPSDIDRYLTRKQRPQLDLNALVDDVVRGLNIPAQQRRAA